MTNTLASTNVAATNATVSAALPNTVVASSTRPLWAAVCVLAVCVMAMGATLVHVNQRPEPLAQASIPLASAFAALPRTQALPSASALRAPVSTENLEQKTPNSLAKHGQTASQKVAQQSSTSADTARASAPVVVTPTPATAPVTEQAKPTSMNAQTTAPASVCGNCGRVETVTPITREGQGSGVGVITGGVLGGVVGNQVGKGSGRAVATVLGAVGGGWAGNAIEKNMKKTTAYSVRIRMQDGSIRNVEQSSAPLVGSKVMVDGNVLRPA